MGAVKTVPKLTTIPINIWTEIKLIVALSSSKLALESEAGRQDSFIFQRGKNKKGVSILRWYAVCPKGPLDDDRLEWPEHRRIR